MGQVSRRGFLRVGGTAGALGALAVAAPAQAWGWSPRGSVARSGKGMDPACVWDAQADPVVAALYERGEVARVNELLRTWSRNDQPLPDGLPADLRDFMAQARKLPSWADPAKLQTVGEFYQTRGHYLGLLYGLGSGMMSTAIPNEARAVYYSQGGADMKDRVAKTAKLGYDIGTLNAYEPDGQMIVTAVKTRLVHAAVRHLLPQSPHWPAKAIPISKADMLVTWHSLPTYAMGKLNEWKISIPTAHSDAFLHLWQVSAHMLGIEDEYIPATWADANAQYPQVMDPVLGPTAEGIALAKILLDMAAEAGGGTNRDFTTAMARYLVGDQIADWVAIPKNAYWDPFVRSGWPQYLAFREGAMYLPPAGYYMFDEFFRQGTLFYFSEGRPIHIEMPSGNRAF